MRSSIRSSNQSFFNDENLKTRFDFTKPNPKNLKELTIAPLVYNTLICSKMISLVTNQGVFALHGHTLAFYEKDLTKSSDAILDINYSTLTRLQFNASFSGWGFRLSKNGNSFDFYCSDKQAIEAWINCLKSFCVLTTFHEDYEPIKPLGKGSFALVCLVESRANKGFYAAKAFHKETNKTSKNTLINEINVMRSVHHDNIIQLHEVHETRNSIYLIMQYIPNKSLRENLKKPSFRADNSGAKIKTATYSLLDALTYLSSRGLMHRDLKPANILVDKDGKLVIADFGLATLVSAQKYSYGRCGTPGYIAPEVFKYNAKNSKTYYDSKCDVFSVGCIFFQMIFGKHLFEAYDASEALYINKNFSMQFDSIRMIQNELDNPLSKFNKQALNLLLQLLEVDPTKRPTAEQALQHDYFSDFPRKSILESKPSMQRLTSQSTQLESLSPMIIKSFEEPIAQSPMERLETESQKSLGNSFSSKKDSLYLPIAKHVSSGRTDSAGNSYGSNFMTDHEGIKTSSFNVSLNLNCVNSGTPGNSNGEIQLSPQKKSTTPIKQRSFLKTAIKNNRKNNEPDWEEQKKLELQTETKQENDIINVDDIGDEDCQIQVNFDNIRHSMLRKHPSKMLESRKKP